MVEATRQSYPFPVSDPGDGSARDVLTEVLRDGAQRMLANAIEDELSVYLKQRTELVDDVGHRQVVRNGYLPKRTILTGLGPVPVRQPRVRDHPEQFYIKED